jgi:hypothetical protein
LKKIALIPGLFLLVLLISGAQAINATQFSMSDLGFTGPQTILVYESGNLIGSYNTSADSIPLPDHDFQVIIKPELKNRSLDQLLTEAMGWITQYWYVLVFFFGGILLLTRRW